jgi:hypothetical protein
LHQFNVECAVFVGQACGSNFYDNQFLGHSCSFLLKFDLSYKPCRIVLLRKFYTANNHYLMWGIFVESRIRLLTKSCCARTDYKMVNRRKHLVFAVNRRGRSQHLVQLRP